MTPTNADAHKWHQIGYIEGRKAMQQDFERQFAQWAQSHPDPVVCDELWAFVDKIREQEMAR